MTPSERDAARRAAYDRKIARAAKLGWGDVSDAEATLYDTGAIALNGEWDVATLSALLQSYLEGK